MACRLVPAGDVQRISSTCQLGRLLHADVPLLRFGEHSGAAIAERCSGRGRHYPADEASGERIGHCGWCDGLSPRDEFVHSGRHAGQSRHRLPVLQRGPFDIQRQRPLPGPAHLFAHLEQPIHLCRRHKCGTMPRQRAQGVGDDPQQHHAGMGLRRNRKRELRQRGDRIRSAELRTRERHTAGDTPGGRLHSERREPRLHCGRARFGHLVPVRRISPMRRRRM